MRKRFVKTNNVKNFIGLVENLQNKPKNIPLTIYRNEQELNLSQNREAILHENKFSAKEGNMGLIYGEPGLGKSQTALWLACKYDAIYLRATNLMTGRCLLEELVKEMDEIPRYLTSDNFNLIVKKLKQNPQLIIIDEIDYLMNNLKTIEILRDIHDETDCPIVFVGMGLVHRKLTKDTLKGYKSQLKFNILPNFGDKFLKEIKTEMINDFMIELKEKYKPKTASNGVTLLGSILKYAFEQGYIKHNPYLGVKNSMCKKGIYE